MADFAQSLFLMIAALLDKRLGKVKRNPSNEAARLCDHRESAEMRLTIAEKLRSKRKCCVGDVVVTLVHKPETVQAVFDKPAQIKLQGYSWGLSNVMSVADMERLHRISKAILVSKLTDWTSFTAASVCRMHRGEALRAAWEARAQLLDHSPKPKAKAKAQAKERKRGKSAFELFKDRFIQDMQADDVDTRPVVFSDPQRIRDSFDELPQEEQNEYETLSQRDKANVKKAKLEKKEGKDKNEEQDKQPTTGSSVSVCLYVAGTDSKMVKVPTMPPCMADGLAQRPLPTASLHWGPDDLTHDAVVKKLGELRGGSALPWHPAIYEQCRTELALPKKTLVADFAGLNRAIASDKGCVPDYVRYPKLCGETCKHDTPKFLAQLRRDIEGALATIVARTMQACSIKVIDTTLRRIMLTIDVREGDFSQLKFTGELTTASCRSGNVPPSQGFQRYCVFNVNTDRRPKDEALIWNGEECYLQPQRRPFVQQSVMEWTLPVSENWGIMDTWTHEDLSEYLVHPFLKDDHHFKDVAITISGIRHKYFKHDLRLCQGVNEDITPIVVTTKEDVCIRIIF